MTIPTLIDKFDTFELVRDQVAAILVAERDAQMALAIAGSQDPERWNLGVFIERSNPWADFESAPSAATPIVSISFDSSSFDDNASNTFERQKSVALYDIVCFGYGKSAEDGAGHIPGDRRAMLEAQRACRLVRNILMAVEHRYLGLRGLVWGRSLRSIRAVGSPTEKRPAIHIGVMHLVLEAHFNEFSPQFVPEELEAVVAQLEVAPSGQVITARFGAPDPP